jgi:hypothetical protein
MTRFERATNSLEGCDSTVELHPQGGEFTPQHFLHTDRSIIRQEVYLVKPLVGLEPTTYGLQNRCSIQLS